MTEKQYNALLIRIAKNIKRTRLAKGLTQEKTAEKADLAYRFYQEVESGRHSMSIYTLGKIASAFHIDISELFSK